MRKFAITRSDEAQAIVDRIYTDLVRRVVSSPPDICPVAVASNFLKQSRSQSCGKCTPCRVGLTKLEEKIDRVLDGKGGPELVREITEMAGNIAVSADCAIGFASAEMVKRGIKVFEDDYLSHATGKGCLVRDRAPIPCISRCPAGVNVPGYIALLHAKNYDEALRLIRQDNPFPAVCGLICEHPCEERCRRNMIDAGVNIRGLKQFISTQAKNDIREKAAEKTGKKIAVIGGGPSGLTCAYFLTLMGHSVTIYERLDKLGGMLRYGIPKYRLPREILDKEIQYIIDSDITVQYNTSLGDDLQMSDIKESYDGIYLSIGAHGSKNLGIPGEDLDGVISAVELLRAIGDENLPDYSGKNVIVIGGGNVAMDVVRTARRLGAKNITCVYRRRQQDMTALPEEIGGAMSEGIELLMLHAPIRVLGNEAGQVTGLAVRKQMVRALDEAGRPRVAPLGESEETILAADIVISAIGQAIETNYETDPGEAVKAGFVVSGGDCVSGPATAILAIAAGKKAANIIDEELGYNHKIARDIVIPEPIVSNAAPCGRVDMVERIARERQGDFDEIEIGLTTEEAIQEAGRCLRCDKFGFGILKGGLSW